MTRTVLLACSLLLLSCKTSRHAELTMSEGHKLGIEGWSTAWENRVVDLSTLMSGHSSDSVRIVIFETEYDTSVTDDDGKHPVLKERTTEIDRGSATSTENLTTSTESTAKGAENVVTVNGESELNTEETKDVTADTKTLVDVNVLAFTVIAAAVIASYVWLKRKKRL